MIHLSATTWERLIIWFVIGMFVYFGYGVWHSKLARQGAPPPAWPPRG